MGLRTGKVMSVPQRDRFVRIAPVHMAMLLHLDPAGKCLVADWTIDTLHPYVFLAIVGCMTRNCKHGIICMELCIGTGVPVLGYLRCSHLY